MPRIECALLFRNDKLGTGFPSLIEISSRAHATTEDLYFCLRHLVFPRREMFKMLKCLKRPSIFNVNDANVMLKKFWMITKERIDTNYSDEDYCKIAIEIMINDRVKIMISSIKFKLTRIDAKKHKEMCRNLKQKRTRRWNNALNLTFQLRSEFNISINECAHEFDRNYVS